MTGSEVLAGRGIRIPMGLQGIYARASEILSIGPEDVLLAQDMAEMAGRQSDPVLNVLLLLMLDALNCGSLCLPLEPACLERGLTDGAADMILEHLERGTWQEIVTCGPDPEFKPLVVHNDLIYFHKYFEVEQCIRKSIIRLSRRRWPVDIEAAARAIDRALGAVPYALDPLQVRAIAMAVVRGFSIISGGPGTGKTTVAAAIVDAVTMVDTLTGREGGTIRLAAPTGRAAARLEASVNRALALRKGGQAALPENAPHSSTIHRLLGLGRRLQAWRTGHYRAISASFILVDEASMVDAAVMARLLESVPEGCRLVLMGDRDQLPSVEAGAVLSDLVPDNVQGMDAETRAMLQEVLPERYQSALHDNKHCEKAWPSGVSLPVTILTRCYRSSPDISRAAEAIRKASHEDTSSAFACFSRLSFDEAAAGRLPGTGTWFVEPVQGQKHMAILLREWFRHALFSAGGKESGSYASGIAGFRPCAQNACSEQVQDRLSRLFLMMERTRVLCLTRTGTRGTNGANAVASSMLKAALSPGFSGQLFHGAMVMSVENDYARKIFNGDVGLVLADDFGGLNVWFPMSDGMFRPFPVAVFRTLELSFAITVHKSQGSEFDRVLLVLPEDQGHRLLSREILYTGVTRARDMVLVAGEEKAFRRAVSRETIRYSGLWR